MLSDVRAAVCHAVGQDLRIENVQLDGPGEGEVLVEVKASGLCHSDYHQMDGSSPICPFPVILGHEGAGVAIECGRGVASVKPGDHVIPLSIAECGVCPNCLSGKTNLCVEFFAGIGRPSRFSMNGTSVAAFSGVGSFANFLVMPENRIARIRKDVPLDVACYLGCGVSTGIGAVLYTAKVEPGSSVVVFGLGGIGLNVLQGAKFAGATKIIGIDTNPRRETVAYGFGATDFINPKTLEGDIVEHLREMTGGGADYSFECVGDVRLIRQAIQCTRPGWGTSIAIGIPPDGMEVSMPPIEILYGRTWKGSFLGNTKSRTDLPKILDWYADGRIKLDELITHRLPLERINEGFDLMKRGDAIRAVVVF